MISDITLGQYFPAKSPMHRTDPRMKICLTVFAIVLIFVARNFLSLAVSVLFIGVGMACSKIPLKLYLKSLKPILFIIVFTAVLNIFLWLRRPAGTARLAENYAQRNSEQRVCIDPHRDADFGKLGADVYHVAHTADGRH